MPHAILMGSLVAFLDGRIDEAVLDLIQIVNPAIAGVIVFLASRGRADA